MHGWRMVFSATALAAVFVILLSGATARADEGKAGDQVMLFPIVKDDSWGYMDKAGKVVIEPEYQLAWDFHEGLACVGKNAMRGFIDKTGKEVVKLQYGWAGRFREGLARVNLHKSKYGRHVDWYKATAGWGFIDKTGGKKPVFRLRYGNRPCDVSEGVVWTGKEYMGTDGKKLAFDGDEGTSFSDGMAAASKGGLWGYIDHSMKFVIEPTYAAARAFSGGLAPVGKAGSAPPAKRGEFQKWLEKNPLKWGYVDKSGKIVIDCRFEDAWLFAEDLAPVKEGGKWGYVNTSGAMVVKPQFGFAWPFSEGKGRVLKGGKHGYIDKTGAMVIGAKFDAAWEFSKGLARVGVGTKEGYIDHSGKYVWEPTE